ncbi:LURP-one-related family protein [Clostridium sp. LY3-2]|uniref:LURP-one-related/scramblase family protein n=1 Tax=Clostridium sp. LY3-2 TaxID=2942482 RepID=UPI0021533E86|nr:LURP-one-related family protein [Clostridium sp. LY3-2]MCR6515049.1 LURP-one-related family protein [Clostridium sp. LY3-2]
MKYILSENLVAISNDYKVKDTEGNLRYEIDGKIRASSEKLYFKDHNGNKLFKLKKKLLSFTDSFIIEKNGEDYAEVHKKLLTPLKENFILDTPYGEIEIKGDFIDHEFEFFDEDDEKIATVSKKLISETDKYVVEVFEFDDHALILAASIIIDLVEHDEGEE